MYVIRELTDLSYPRIAEAFGGRDHTTVMYAVDKIKQQMTERHVIFDQVNELIGRIRLGAVDNAVDDGGQAPAELGRTTEHRMVVGLGCGQLWMTGG